MSSALLKKSLELVESDYKCNVFKRKGQGAYSQIKLTSKGKKHKEIRGAADVKKKNLKTVEKIKGKSKNKRDKVKENVRKLKKLHKINVEDSIIKLILDDCKKPGTESELTVEEPKRVLTEEDFTKFEREYFAE